MLMYHTLSSFHQVNLTSSQLRRIELPQVSPKPISNCVICGMTSTGKHYGVISCDGCKGFFRRSIRKENNYTCRFNQGCIIDLEKRNQCRFCRLKKCLSSGMQKTAVQSERDHIKVEPAVNSQSSAVFPDGFSNTMDKKILEQLMHAECGIQESNKINNFRGTRTVAGIPELLNSIKEQLVVLVEWAKMLSQFEELEREDKVALLRAHAAEQLLLGVSKRSRFVNGREGNKPVDDILVLGNEYCLPRYNTHDPEIGAIAGRVLDEVVANFRKLDIDETEFMCLKAIIFFDPHSRGLTNSALVSETRQRIHVTLMHYTMGLVESPFASNDSSPTNGPTTSSTTVLDRNGSGAAALSANFHTFSNFPPTQVQTPAQPHRSKTFNNSRFGEILLMIPMLQNIAIQMIDHMQLVQLLGVARMDNLLHEMLLGGPNRPSSTTSKPEPVITHRPIDAHSAAAVAPSWSVAAGPSVGIGPQVYDTLTANDVRPSCVASCSNGSFYS